MKKKLGNFFLWLTLLSMTMMSAACAVDTGGWVSKTPATTNSETNGGGEDTSKDSGTSGNGATNDSSGNVSDNGNSVSSEPVNSAGNDSAGKDDTVTLGYKTARYVATPVDESSTTYRLQSSFRDENYYYYMFYIGEIQRVPLQDDVRVLEYSGIDHEYTVTTTVSTSSTIESSLSNADTLCTNWTDTLSSSSTLSNSISSTFSTARSTTESTDIGASVGNEKVFQVSADHSWGSTDTTSSSKTDSITSTINQGFASAWGGSSSNNITSSLKKAETYSETNSVTEKISFNSNYAKGYYRLILMGDIDVYATIVYDIENDEYYYGNVDNVSTTYYAWDYSESPKFPSDGSLLSFTMPDIADLMKPETFYKTQARVTLDTDGMYKEYTIYVNLGYEVELPVLEEDGYLFTGWYTENGQKLDNNTIAYLTEDITVYAHWENKPYTINLNTNQRNILSTAKISESTFAVTYAKAVRTLPVPTAEGYKFLGWYTEDDVRLADENGKPINIDAYIDADGNWICAEDVTLYAKWEIQEYKVTVAYQYSGEEPFEYRVIVQNYGSEYTIDQIEKLGYSFEVVDPNAGKIPANNDSIVTVTYTSLTYKIALIVSSENYAKDSADSTYDESLKEQLTDDIYLDSVPIGKLQVPKATYYVFDGWFTSDGTPVTNSDGTFIDNVEGYIENGNWVRSNEKQTVLYARWVKTYNNYTYLSTVADLKKIGTTGNYLIINDIDYNGGTWTPISKFSGIINGLEHTIYNFKITEGIKDDPSSGFKTSTAGFIATNSGTIKNLQIGKSGYSTYISISSWNILKQCGMIAGYNSGTIANCRVVNCTISASAEANSDSYSKSELWVNCGAICGVIRGGSIQRCYVDSCTITATSKATYNGIQAMARAAGIAGFTANFSVSDCFVLNCKFSAEATTNGEFANKGGNATAHVGGLIGSANSESGNAAIIRSVVYNNSIDASATCKWGGSSNTYKGSMFGKTNDTSPKNLIMIDTTLDCSGSNSSYDNYIKIDKNSYSLLISKNSAFNNGYWKANSDGTITLDFTKLA